MHDDLMTDIWQHFHSFTVPNEQVCPQVKIRITSNSNSNLRILSIWCFTSFLTSSKQGSGEIAVFDAITYILDHIFFFFLSVIDVDSNDTLFVWKCCCCNMLSKKNFCGNLKHSRWSSRCRFVAYVAPPADSSDQGLMGEWAERLQYISTDLHWLLQLPHQQFWCQVRKIIITYAANFIYRWDCVLSNTKVRGGILKYHVHMAVSVSDHTGHFSNRFDIYKVAKVYHRDQSDKHCNWSNTLSCILLLELQ